MNRKRILSLLLALIMAFSLFSCSKAGDGGEETGGGPLEIAGTENLDSPPAVWSETAVVSENMFVYYYNAYYRYFLETYKNSLSSMGLDPSKSLSEQQQSEEYTWQQYITIQVYQQLREMIALADAAKAEGMTLDEEDLKKLDSEMEVFESLAASYGTEVGEFVEKTYGKGVTVDAIRTATSLRLLANKYYQKLWDSYTFTEEECLAEYEAKRNSFVHFDYLKITVPAEDAASLKAATDKESFIEAMRASVTKNNFLGDYDRFSDTIEAQLKKKQYYRADYDENSELCKWAVAEGRKPYEIFSKTESTGDITVAMILPTTDPGAINEVIYRDDLPLKNLQYIVFADSQGTSGATKAQTIQTNWQENPTEERFVELCEEYNGGKAENVARHQFNEDVNEWVFSEERKAGDCGIVETDGGAYLLYMLEDGEPSWITEVKNILKNQAYETDMEEIIDKYPTQYNPDFIYNVIEVKVFETSAPAETTAAAQ